MLPPCHLVMTSVMSEHSKEACLTWTLVPHSWEQPMLLNSPTSKDAYDQCFITATKKQVRTPCKSPEVGCHLIKSAHTWISNFQPSELWKNKFWLFPSCPKYPDNRNLGTKRICFSSQSSGYSPSLQGSQGSTCLKKLGHIRSEAEEGRWLRYILVSA